MYVSSKHHIGKRAGLKNRGYFDLEDDYEDFEGLITHDMQAIPGRMHEKTFGKPREGRKSRTQVKSGFLSYEPS